MNQVEQMPVFSFYRQPIKNTKPQRAISLKQLHQLITGKTLEATTSKCRVGPSLLSDTKAKNLPYVTFAGTFSKRGDKYLLKKSGYYCFDLDKLEDVQATRDRILAIKDDDYFATNLVFVSPSGKGLKWVISITENGKSYGQNYKWLLKYLAATHGFENLDTVSDVSRACFLCHDPQAYYNEDNLPCKKIDPNEANPPTLQTQRTANGIGTNGQEYNYRDTLKAFTDAGYTIVGTQTGDKPNTRILRAGDTSSESSGCVYHDTGNLYMFSTGTEFVAQEIYSYGQVCGILKNRTEYGEKEEEYRPLHTYELPLEQEVKFPDATLRINGHRFLGPGEYGCFCGLPQSGKTAIIEAYTIAFLQTYHHEKIKGLDTWGIEISNPGGGPLVRLDTERSPDDNVVSLRRIKRKINAEALKLTEKYKDGASRIKGFYHHTLAEVPKFEDLKELLLEAFILAENGHLLIDGILDFALSMNNEEDTRSLLQRIRCLAVKHSVTVLMTLHPNKMSEILAGHLGSNISRWARAVALIRRCKEDKSVMELTCEFDMAKLSHAQTSTFDPVYFMWREALGDFASCDKPEATVFDRLALGEILRGALTSGSGKMKSSEVKKLYAEAIGISEDSTYRHFKQALNAGFMMSEGKGKATVYWLNEGDDDDDKF